MKKDLYLFLARVDAFCGHLNHGLAAVAIVLSVCVGAMATVRGAELLAQSDLPAIGLLPLY